MKKEEEPIILYVPIGVSTRIDYFPGFGKKELFQSLIGIFIGVLIAILLYIMTSQFLFVTITMISAIAVSIFACQKTNNNQSIIDIFNDMKKFNSERKHFPYQQLKEW